MCFETGKDDYADPKTVRSHPCCSGHGMLERWRLLNLPPPRYFFENDRFVDNGIHSLDSFLMQIYNYMLNFDSERTNYFYTNDHF